MDQTRLNGHQDRPQDLDAFAALGIRAMRYPVIWERIAPDGLERADWAWTDERLGRLRALGIRPIAGLLHHGSGPRDTDLAQPDFPARLACFAGAVAERYPWVEEYTPVNEPLTTARFSGLYGHWYPHGHDQRLFLRLLVNQIQGTRLAMHAIRRVNPAARLVQTDDLGRVLSTPHLAYQAEYENHRRWLGFDLLMGRVDRHHPLWRDLADAVPIGELEELLADPCPPDILGINHYLSGERFLDERLGRYPGVAVGGNGRDRYVDVLALRTVARGVAGLGNLLQEAWDRYRLPIALTEIHNGSSRDEQLRWLKEAWDAAVGLRDRGVDLRAVTAWSLLGAFDWNSLLTRQDGHYEPGVYDVSGGGAPRPTALAGLIGDLAKSGTSQHPALDTPGWWHRESRFAWAPTECAPALLPRASLARPRLPGQPRALLITGGDGALARALAEACVQRGLPHRLLSRVELDVTDAAAVAAAIDRWRPWAVLNAAGYAHVERAEAAPERCWRENVEGAAVLGLACAAAGLPCVAFSSHLVFGGGQAAPYLETDPIAPRGVYATSKAAAEQVLHGVSPEMLIVRAGSFFGPQADRNALACAVRAVGAGRSIAAAADVTVSPTYLPDLADAVLDLLMDGEAGIWHLANPGCGTWAEIIREVVGGLSLDPAKVIGVPAATLGRRAPWPAQSALRSGRSALMPPLGQALQRYLGALRADARDAAA
ncbi:family 1 glycosylhydrolase [Dankookia sp. GCM10030260]